MMNDIEYTAFTKLAGAVAALREQMVYALPQLKDNPHLTQRFKDTLEINDLDNILKEYLADCHPLDACELPTFNQAVTEDKPCHPTESNMKTTSAHIVSATGEQP